MSYAPHHQALICGDLRFMNDRSLLYAAQISPQIHWLQSIMRGWIGDTVLAGPAAGMTLQVRLFAGASLGISISATSCATHRADRTHIPGLDWRHVVRLATGCMRRCEAPSCTCTSRWCWFLHKCASVFSFKRDNRLPTAWIQFSQAPVVVTL